MNIRANIFGGPRPRENIVFQSKKPKGVDPDSLDSLIEREALLTNHNRFEDRHRLLDETVRIARGGRTHDVQLINLSGGGAMIECADTELLLWDKLELCLGENGTVECAVRWLRGDRFGLEFAHETRINCGVDEQARVLREVIRRSFPGLEFEADGIALPDRSGPDARSELRHPLVWSGLLHHDYDSTRVRLRNISTTGAMIDCSALLRVAAEPVLELGENLMLSVTVVWVVGDEAGLRFTSPFDLYDLARSRPEVAGSNWQPPAYLDTGSATESPWADHWGRSSLSELREDLEGFLKR
jgi:hypothetical protein